MTERMLSDATELTMMPRKQVKLTVANPDLMSHNNLLNASWHKRKQRLVRNAGNSQAGMIPCTFASVWRHLVSPVCSD